MYQNESSEEEIEENDEDEYEDNDSIHHLMGINRTVSREDSLPPSNISIQNFENIPPGTTVSTACDYKYADIIKLLKKFFRAYDLIKNKITKSFIMLIDVFIYQY